MPILLLLIVLLTIIPWTASSQQQSPTQPNPAQQSGLDAWNKRDWPRAASSYRTLVAADSTQMLPHFRLGVALTALRQYAEAKKHLAIAEKLGGPVPQVGFRMALADAGAGKLDSAFAQLKRATDAGLAITPIPGDSLAEMQIVKRDSRFAEFTTNMDRNARPCMYDPKASEFDFWVGVWEVRPRANPAAPPSKSVITKEETGCVIHETYKTQGTYTGQSFNAWDGTRQKWFQYYVDNTGGVHEYSGIVSDNILRYEGTTPGPGTPPTRIPTKMTFFKIAADTVRQFGEVKNADGTWVTSYDLIYTRVKGN